MSMNIRTSILRPKDIYAYFDPSSNVQIKTGSSQIKGVRIEPKKSVNGSATTVTSANGKTYGPDAVIVTAEFNEAYAGKQAAAFLNFAKIALNNTSQNLSGSYQNEYNVSVARADRDSSNINSPTETFTAEWFWPIIVAFSDANGNVVGKPVFDQSAAYELYETSDQLSSSVTPDNMIYLSNFGNVGTAKYVDFYIPLYGTTDPEFSVRLYNEETKEAIVFPWKYGTNSEGYKGIVDFGAIIGVGSGTTGGAKINTYWASDTKWQAWRNQLSGTEIIKKKYRWYRYSYSTFKNFGGEKTGAAFLLNGRTTDTESWTCTDVNSIHDAKSRFSSAKATAPEICIQSGFVRGTVKDWSKTTTSQWIKMSVSDSKDVFSEVLALKDPSIFKVKATESDLDLSPVTDGGYFERNSSGPFTITYRGVQGSASKTIGSKVGEVKFGSDTLFDTLSLLNGKYASESNTKHMASISQAVKIVYDASLQVSMKSAYRKYGRYRTIESDTLYSPSGTTQFVKDYSGKLTTAFTGCLRGCLPQIMAGFVMTNSSSYNADTIGSMMFGSDPVSSSAVRVSRVGVISDGSRYNDDSAACTSFDFRDYMTSSYDAPPSSSAAGTYYRLGSDSGTSWSVSGKGYCYAVVLQKVSNDGTQNGKDNTARWQMNLKTGSGKEWTIKDIQRQSMGEYVPYDASFCKYKVYASKVSLPGESYRITSFNRYQPFAAKEYTATFYINKGGVTVKYKEIKSVSGVGQNSPYPGIEADIITTPAYPALQGDYDGYSYTVAGKDKWLVGGTSTYVGQNEMYIMSKNTSFTLKLTKNTSHVIYMMASAAMEAPSNPIGRWVTGGIYGSGQASSLIKVGYQDSSGIWRDATAGMPEGFLTQKTAYNVTAAQCNNPEPLYDPSKNTDTWYISMNLNYNQEYTILYRKNFTKSNTTYEITKNATAVSLNSVQYVMSSKFKLTSSGITVTQSPTEWEATNSSAYSHGPNPGGKWLLWQLNQPIVYRSTSTPVTPTTESITTSTSPGGGMKYITLAKSGSWSLVLYRAGTSPSNDVSTYKPDNNVRTIHAGTYGVNGLYVIWTGSGVPASGTYKLEITKLNLQWNFSQITKINGDTVATFYGRTGDATVSNVSCTFTGTSRVIDGMYGTGAFKTGSNGNAIITNDYYVWPTSGNPIKYSVTNYPAAGITKETLGAKSGQTTDTVKFKVTKI